MPPYSTSCASFFGCVDVRDELFKLLPLCSLLALAATNRAYHDAVFCFFRHRIILLVAPFFPHQQMFAFLECLRKVGAVISGSAVLKLLFSWENRLWDAKDLDVYVAYENAIPFLDFLHSCGYSCISMLPSHPYLIGSIRSVVTFCQGARKIDVILSRTSSSIMPIFEFHLTAVMNFISPNFLFSAYPFLTSSKCAIVNPRLFHFGRVKLPTLQALLKYRGHGFQIQSSCESRLVDLQSRPTPHRCGSAIGCSKTHRSTTDRGCLFVHFREFTDEMNDMPVFDEIGWHLGGRRCSLQLGYDVPYVVTK